MSGDLPTPEEVLAAHEVIEEVYDLKYPGVRVPAPALKLRRDVLACADEYDDSYCRAAALLRKLITTHVFEDANKRTGWAVTENHLRRNDLNVPSDDEFVYRVLRRIRRFDVAELAEWLETGTIDEARLPES